MTTIVVGVDGSRASIAALRFALREARAHGSSVKAVAAWHVPNGAYGAGLAPSGPDPEDFERAAEEALDVALAATAADAHDVAVERVVREGEAAHVLVAESEDAAQLVVGCRNLGIVGRIVRHTVSGHCTRDAHCPVTVVHAKPEG